MHNLAVSAPKRPLLRPFAALSHFERMQWLYVYLKSRREYFPARASLEQLAGNDFVTLELLDGSLCEVVRADCLVVGILPVQSDRAFALV